MGVMTRIQDLDQVLSQTNEQRNRILASVARNIRVWFIKVRKVAGIYHTLNMFSVDLGQKCLIGEAWCPVADIDRIQLALRRGTERCGGSVNSILQRIKSNMTPPTYFRTNKFTSSFQARVSTSYIESEDLIMILILMSKIIISNSLYFFSSLGLDLGENHHDN